MAEGKLVRVQERGQVTLPAEFRRRMGLKKGDVVAVFETEDGVVIAPREVVATKLLDRIAEALKEQGLNLEDLIESGREERGKLLEEQYGLRSDSD